MIPELGHFALILAFAVALIQGTLGADGVFAAREVLAKHDEKYMPPEVAKALKESGRWKEGEGTTK